MMAGGKRTDDRVEKICEALRIGNARKASAAYAGICEKTFYNWLRFDTEFQEAVRRAEAEAECRNVQVIQEASERSWQAAAWWLERRRPADWRQTRSVETLLAGLSDEQLLSLMEKNFGMEGNPGDQDEQAS